MKISESKFDALMDAFRVEMFEKDVDIHARKKRFDFCCRFEISWWAVGSVMPDRASRFAVYLANIAKLVEKLNMLEIDVDYKMSDGIRSQREYDRLRDDFREAIRNFDGDLLCDLLKG